MPYLFSCSLDKQVKCWDLETNKVSGGSHSVIKLPWIAPQVHTAEPSAGQ